VTQTSEPDGGRQATATFIRRSCTPTTRLHQYRNQKFSSMQSSSPKPLLNRFSGLVGGRQATEIGIRPNGTPITSRRALPRPSQQLLPLPLHRPSPPLRRRLYRRQVRGTHHCRHPLETCPRPLRELLNPAALLSRPIFRRQLMLRRRLSLHRHLLLHRKVNGTQHQVRRFLPQAPSLNRQRLHTRIRKARSSRQETGSASLESFAECWRW